MFEDEQLGSSCVDTKYILHYKFVYVLTHCLGASQIGSFSEDDFLIWFLNSYYANVIRESTSI
jgi:hypothetical protein